MQNIATHYPRIVQRRSDKEQQREDKQELKAIYDKQVQDLKKSYEELNSQTREDLLGSFYKEKTTLDSVVCTRSVTGCQDSAIVVFSITNRP